MPQVEASYPNSIATDEEFETELIGYGSGDGNGNMINWQTHLSAEWLNKLKKEIQAIETELGILPKGAYDSITSRLDAGTGHGTIELHAIYNGYVQTNRLRGAAESGSNSIAVSSGNDVVSDIGRNYIEGSSSEATLQDTYIVVNITLPEDFTSWSTSNAIQLQYITESISSTNCHVDIYVYKAGTAEVVASNEDNVSTSWAVVTIDDSALGSWSPGDILELYIKLNSKSDYYARIAKISLNYV